MSKLSATMLSQCSVQVGHTWYSELNSLCSLLQKQQQQQTGWAYVKDLIASECDLIWKKLS